MTTNSRNTGILSPHVSCRSVVLAAVSTALIMLATLSIAPFGKLACPIFPPFVLMYAAIMSAMSGLTGYLVAVQFRARREPLLGALSGAFGYVSVLAFSQILVFPAALSPSMSSSGGPQSAIWMWVLWHAGFPVFVLIGGLLQKADLPGRTGGLPKRLGCALIPGGPAIGIFFAYYCISQGRNLPALISGMSYVA